MYRTDANHLPIKRALLAVGRPVKDTSPYHGFGCDIVTEHLDGHLVLLEVKDGKQPPSRRKLTESEQALRDMFPHSFHVVLTEEEALAAVGLRQEAA